MQNTYLEREKQTIKILFWHKKNEEIDKLFNMEQYGYHNDTWNVSCSKSIVNCLTKVQ